MRERKKDAFLDAGIPNDFFLATEMKTFLKGWKMIGRKGVTKREFGRILKADIPARVVWQQKDNIVIELTHGNIYHGKVTEFVLD